MRAEKGFMAAPAAELFPVRRFMDKSGRGRPGEPGCFATRWRSWP